MNTCNSRRRPLRILLVAALVTCHQPNLVAQVPRAFPNAWRVLAEQFENTLTAEGIVGGSLWFVLGDSVLAREFHGWADIAESRPVDEATIFHWGSITKTLTGIATMQLRDRGLLGLDDPIIRHVPELRLVHSEYVPVERVTLRHLLSHSAGFRGPTWPWGGDEPWHPHEPTEWAQLVAMMPYTQLLFEPGSRFSYSNPGIIFVGRTIEDLTGDDWEVYVDKNILKPLHMYQSYFDRTPYHLLPYRSNNYYVLDGEPQANGLDFDTGITVSNGGLNAPISDMVKYLAFLVGQPERRETYDSILDRSTLEEMWEIQVPVSRDSTPGSLQESVGITFFVMDQGDLRFIGHTGSQKAFFSFFYVDPQSGAGAIAAFNTVGVSSDGPARPDARAILNDLRSELFTQIFPLFR